METTTTTSLTCPVDHNHHNTRVLLRVVAMMTVVVCQNFKAARWERIDR